MVRNSKTQAKIPLDLQPWIEASKLFQLSHAHVQMARELELNPKKLGKLANHDQEPWKPSGLSAQGTSFRVKLGHKLGSPEERVGFGIPLRACFTPSTTKARAAEIRSKADLESREIKKLAAACRSRSRPVTLRMPAVIYFNQVGGSVGAQCLPRLDERQRFNSPINASWDTAERRVMPSSILSRHFGPSSHAVENASANSFGR